MTLAELLATVADLDEGHTVYATKPWTATSQAIAALGVWSRDRAGACPSPSQASDAVIHYAEYDSYLRPNA